MLLEKPRCSRSKQRLHHDTRRSNQTGRHSMLTNSWCGVVESLKIWKLQTFLGKKTVNRATKNTTNALESWIKCPWRKQDAYVIIRWRRREDQITNWPNTSFYSLRGQYYDLVSSSAINHHILQADRGTSTNIALLSSKLQWREQLT
jgi:hypothetical protein